MANITSIKIHPAIGIARLGNSPTEFFIRPELPGDRRPRRVKELEWIEMAQLAVSSILFQSLSLKLP